MDVEGGVFFLALVSLRLSEVSAFFGKRTRLNSAYIYIYICIYIYVYIYIYKCFVAILECTVVIIVVVV